jgi:hypothetical protein
MPSKQSLSSSVKSQGADPKAAAAAAAASPEEPDDEEEEEPDEIGYDEIAAKIPDVKLALVLEAEKQFGQADADGSGSLDVNGV